MRNGRYYINQKNVIYEEGEIYSAVLDIALKEGDEEELQLYKVRYDEENERGIIISKVNEEAFIRDDANGEDLIVIQGTTVKRIVNIAEAIPDGFGRYLDKDIIPGLTMTVVDFIKCVVNNNND